MERFSIVIAVGAGLVLVLGLWLAGLMLKIAAIGGVAAMAGAYIAIRLARGRQ